MTLDPLFQVCGWVHYKLFLPVEGTDNPVSNPWRGYLFSAAGGGDRRVGTCPLNNQTKTKEFGMKRGRGKAVGSRQKAVGSK
jgi:hypothetical protein